MISKRLILYLSSTYNARLLSWVNDNEIIGCYAISCILWMLCYFVRREDVWTLYYLHDFKKVDLLTSFWSIDFVLRHLQNEIFQYGMIPECVCVCMCVCASVFITVVGGNYFHKLPSVHKREFPIQYTCKFILFWWGY